MKRVMNKKGLSTIVATLLILLLIFVAIGIVWVVVRNVIQEGSEQVSLGKFTLNLEISQVQILTESSVNVRVKRNTGEGDFVALNFVVSDGNSSEVIKKVGSLAELEEQNFELTLSVVDAFYIQNIGVAPVFKLDSGKEVIGDIKDEYEFSSENSGTCTQTCSSLGWSCSSVCGEACGTCDIGEVCSGGNCVTPSWNNGLISWWTFDEDATDAIGSNDGTVNGASHTTSGCQNNGCYDFDGVDDYIVAGYDGADEANVDVGEAKTFAVSFKADSSISPSYLYWKEGGCRGWYFYLQDDGDVHFNFATEDCDNRNNYRVTSSEVSYKDNQWHQAVGIIDRVSGNMELYIDGELIGSDNPDNTENAAGGTIYFGRFWRWEPTDPRFEGSLDEGMIWNRALTESEVSDLYNYFN